MTAGERWSDYVPRILRAKARISDTVFAETFETEEEKVYKTLTMYLYA